MSIVFVSLFIHDSASGLLLVSRWHYWYRR